MFPRIVLAVSDRPCAQVALRTLEALSAHPAGELILLGVVQPFRTVYVHKHPVIGRRIRNLLRQVTREDSDDVQQLVRDTSASFRSLGWDVRSEVREGPIVEEILRCCVAQRPQLLIVGSCLADATGLWGPRAVWQEIVNQVPCPVLVVKHAEAELSGEARPAEEMEQARVTRYQAGSRHAV